MFHSIFEALDCFIIVFLINIDIRKIIVRISVPRIYLDTLYMIFFGLLNHPHFFVDVCHVIIKHIKLRINYDCFIEVLN